MVGDPEVCLLPEVRLTDFKCSHNIVNQELQGFAHFQGEITRLFFFSTQDAVKTLEAHL